MEKFLLRVELRYCNVPKSEYYPAHNYEYTTIGIYDSFKEACIAGNEVLNNTIKKYNLKVDDSFSEHGGPFGGRKTLVTNCFYSDPIEYFAEITTLKFIDLSERIEHALKSQKEYDARTFDE
jgi:hypothetical protein